MIRNSYLLSSRTTLHLARAGPEWMLGISKGMSYHTSNEQTTCTAVRVSLLLMRSGRVSYSLAVATPRLAQRPAGGHCAALCGGAAVRRRASCEQHARCEQKHCLRERTSCRVQTAPFAFGTCQTKAFCPSLPPCHGALRLPKYNGLEGFGAWAWYSLRPKVTDIRFRGAVRGRIKFRTD